MIQKQYEKKIKVSTNKDTFTTYQRKSHQHHSPFHERQRIEQEHHRIESLRSTLNSMSQQASIELARQPSNHTEHAPRERYADEHQNHKYDMKLDELCKNLQHLASKGHFSPANSLQQRPKSSTLNCSQPNPAEVESFQKSQKFTQYYQPIRTEAQQTRFSNNSLQLPASHSQSFIRKEGSHLNSKSNSQNKSIQEHSKSSQEVLWSGKGEFKNNSKKTFSKRDIISEPIAHLQNSKNLSKIFQRFEEAVVDMPRMRERADTQLRQNPTSFSGRVHRARITSILVTDQIYTSSLDYTIVRTVESEGEFKSEVADRFRGGVNYVGLINSKIFGGGRDCYLRSLDGNFHHRFQSSPLRFFESDKISQINIGFVSNRVMLFDIQKRVAVCSLLADKSFQMMSKLNKDLLLGDANKLVAVDWRRKEPKIVLLQSPIAKQWLSSPFDNQFAYHSLGVIEVFGEALRKSYSFQLPANETFRDYDWSRTGIVLLSAVEGTRTARVVKIRGEKDKDDIDIEANGDGLSHVVLREKQIIYGGVSGEIIIKKVKR